MSTKYTVQFLCQGHVVKALEYEEAPLIPRVGEKCELHFEEMDKVIEIGACPSVEKITYIYGDISQIILIALKPDGTKKSGMDRFRDARQL